MKKIISFSLWGDNPKYLQGAIENIKLQKQLFPDWICRFYYHESINHRYISELYHDGAEIIIKHENPVIKHMDAPGMFWRFEVLKDSDVERFIVRDCDGRLSQREVNCVKDWEFSEKEFHIIRDHIHHNTKIMGGVWGATKEFINRIDYDDLLKQFNTLQYNNIYASDQEFLARMIYPLIKESACIHDDWDRYRENAKKIPHMREENHFIGEPIEL